MTFCLWRCFIFQLLSPPSVSPSPPSRGCGNDICITHTTHYPGSSLSLLLCVMYITLCTQRIAYLQIANHTLLWVQHPLYHFLYYHQHPLLHTPSVNPLYHYFYVLLVLSPCIMLDTPSVKVRVQLAKQKFN